MGRSGILVSGMKKIVLLFFICFLLIPNKVLAWTNGDAGIQKFHQTSVPQINSSGKIQNSYTSDSFFPLGLYWFDSRYLQQIKDAGFNMVNDADWQGAPISIPKYDVINQYGIKVIPNIHNYIGRNDNNTVARGDWSVLTYHVNALKNHPATLAWYLSDEQGGDLTIAQWLDVYNHIKALDPNRAIMGELAMSPINGIRGCIDVKVDMTNIYSYPIMTGLDSLHELTRSINGHMNLGCPWPLFIILQAFKGDYWPIMPTPEQIGGQMFTSIVHGATGVWLFVGFPPTGILNGPNTGLWPGTTIWNAASVANHEIEANKRIFLSKTATDEYHIAFNKASGQMCIPNSSPWCDGCGNPHSCHDFDEDLGACSRKPGCNEDNGRCSGEWCEDDCSARKDSSCSQISGCTWHDRICSQSSSVPLHTMLKDTGEPGVRYLLAVNLDATILEGQFTFTRKITKVTSVFDSRSVTPANMVFTDNFGGYGYRLYKIEFGGANIINISNLRSLLQNFTNIFDYNLVVGNYGKWN